MGVPHRVQNLSLGSASFPHSPQVHPVRRKRAIRAPIRSRPAAAGPAPAPPSGAAPLPASSCALASGPDSSCSLMPQLCSAEGLAAGQSPQLFSLFFTMNAIGLTSMSQLGARLVRKFTRRKASRRVRGENSLAGCDYEC
jgi:hypothetical protein